MAVVPVTLVVVVYPRDKSGDPYPATLVGYAWATGLGVGGGPVAPGAPPGQPAHPIVLPPNLPAHPIVIPPAAPGIPTHPIVLPEPPTEPPELPTVPSDPKPPPPGGGWGWSPEYGWGYFPGTGGAGPKK